MCSVLYFERVWLACRLAGGAQLDSQSHGAFASYRAVSHLCRNNLRNRRARTVLREPAQDLLRQPYTLVLYFRFHVPQETWHYGLMGYVGV